MDMNFLLYSYKTDFSLIKNIILFTYHLYLMEIEGYP